MAVNGRSRHRGAPESKAGLRGTLSYPGASVVVCTAVGEVDLVTGPILRATVWTAVRARRRCVIVDLSAVSFFALAGVDVLHDARTVLDPDQELVLVVTRPVQRRVLELCQVPYQLCDDLDSAIDACEPPIPGRNRSG